MFEFKWMPSHENIIEAFLVILFLSSAMKLDQVWALMDVTKKNILMRCEVLILE
jgi:hypothetical protein